MAIDPETGQLMGVQPDAADITAGFFEAARARLKAQDWSSVFTDLLTENDSRGFSPAAVPPGLHPLGQIGAAFASTLAEQLGAPNAVAAHENRVQQVEAQRERVRQENAAGSLATERSKMEQNIKIRLAIAEAKAEQAKRLGMLDEYEARLKTSHQLSKELLKLREEAKLDFMTQSNKQILDRALKVEAERGNQARQTLNYRVLVKEAEKDPKASEGLKAWLRMKRDQIFQKDIAGEAVYTPEQQEKMAEDVYQEFQEKLADENVAKLPQGDAAPKEKDFFDALFGD